MRATEALLAPFRDAPATSVVLVDFDGTLAPIVDDPAAARPLPGVVAALTAFEARGGGVAVLSGRPVSFLVEHLSPEISVFGLYGLERRVDGVVTVDPEAGPWAAAVDATVARAEAELPPGVEVEHKGLSLTLHVRRHPDLADAARAWAAAVAADTGLVVRSARMSIELHPPVARDKGSVVDELVAGRAAACFVGDDLGDRPAFEAIDRFAAGGGHGVKVLVRSSETAPELLPLADLEVDGPTGVLELLRSLLA